VNSRQRPQHTITSPRAVCKMKARALSKHINNGSFNPLHRPSLQPTGLFRYGLERAPQRVLLHGQAHLHIRYRPQQPPPPGASPLRTASWRASACRWRPARCLRCRNRAHRSARPAAAHQTPAPPHQPPATDNQPPTTISSAWPRTTAGGRPAVATHREGDAAGEAVGRLRHASTGELFKDHGERVPGRQNTVRQQSTGRRRRRRLRTV
jgi:hypothetical protein